MNYLESELHGLEKLYQSLEIRLDKQSQDLLGNCFPEAEEAAEAARLHQQILEAETRLTQLVPVSRDSIPLSVAERGTITACAAALRQRAHHLLEIIERNAAQCRQFQSAAQSGLQELQRGGQFLQSVRGYRENQPKFLDSRQ